MNDFAPSPLLEDEVRAAMAVADPTPAFVNSLRTRLVLEADRRVQARRRPQLRLAWGLSLLVVAGLLIAVLVIGPGRVLAAVRGVMGYLPGLGVVQNDGNLRVLAEPVQVVRDGITLTVEQAAADAQRTVLAYSVEGLSIKAANSQGEAAATGGPVSLLLPNGTSLRLVSSSSYGWSTGYQDRLVFPALPSGVQDLTLVISRLNDMPAGAAPEDWRIALRFRPAPPSTQMLPVHVIEPPQPGPGLPAAEATHPPAVRDTTPTPAGPGAMGDNEQPSIRFRLLQAVELPDGYLLQGSLIWEGGGEVTGLQAELWPALHDANGQAIPAAPVTPDVIPTPDGRPASYWALRVDGKSYSGPWVLTLAAARVNVRSQAALLLDLGRDPQPGQMWQLDQELEVAGRRLQISTAGLSQGQDGRTWLEFSFIPGSGLAAASLWDLDQPAGLKGHSSGAPSGEVTAGLGYLQMPSGLRRLTVRNASFVVQGPWQVTWMPPAGETGSPAPIATASPCVSAEDWQKGRENAQPAGGLTGWLLLQQDTGGHMPEIALVRPDGSARRVLAKGAWSALSPDGLSVAFLPEDGGLRLAHVQTGESESLPGTLPEDYSPRWSPDGRWVAFLRGVQGVYLIRPDGTGLRSLGGIGSISLAGWLPDSRGLVIAVLGRDGSQVQTLDIETGGTRKGLLIENAKGGFPALSPDGQRLAFLATMAGQPGQASGLFVANLDGSARRLIAVPGSEVGDISATTWSPGGRWLVVTWGQATTLLIQPDTCQVAGLNALRGNVTSWVAAK